MATKAEKASTPERVGRWLGKGWLGLKRRNVSTVRWFHGKGVPEWVTKPLLLCFELGLVGVLFYVAFWAAFVVLVGLVVVLTIGSASRGREEDWAIGEQADHKKSVFYDPINYNDPPDSRFDDD